MPYLLAISSASEAVTEFVSIAQTVWSFLTGNWYFLALIAIPLGAMAVSVVMGVVRSFR